MGIQSKSSSFKRKAIQKLIERDGFVCGICGESLEEAYKLYLNWQKELEAHVKLSFKRSKINFSIDHVLPKSKGGSWGLENLVLSHSTCNNKKGDKILTKKHESTPDTL